MATRKFRQKLNPNFAAAHGLDNQVSEENPSRINTAKKKARDTGKLAANDANLLNLKNILDLKVIVKEVSLEKSYVPTYVAENLTFLDISDNSELEWDETILQCSLLQTLLARHCHFQEWKTNTDAFKNLEKLDLSGNFIKEFKLDCLPKTIRELNLSSNQIEHLLLPTAERDLELPNLIKLSLQENQLGNIPSRVDMPMLRDLHCGRNQLTELLVLKQNFPNLTNLDASNNVLTILPDLQHLTSLTTIQLDFNKLTQFPKMPSTVVRVVLNENKITALQPSKMETDEILLPNVAVLLIRNNCLTELEGFMVEKWTKLKTLDLYGNSIKTLPYQLGFLSELSTLHIEGNQLRSIGSSNLSNTPAVLQLLRRRAPETVGENVRKVSTILSEVLVKSTTFTLENKKLEELPKELLEELQRNPVVCNRIKHLKLTNNRLLTIHEDWIATLPHLISIHLDNNQIQKLPVDPLIKIKNLEELRLFRNHLQDSALQQLGCSNFLWKNLNILDVSLNRLTKFPKELLSKLPNLRVLNLSSNKIAADLEDWNSPPSSLEVLDLSDNQIVEIGQRFILSLVAHCLELKTLLLGNNCLPSIPLEIGLLPASLNCLDLRGNPQRAVRYSVLERSASEQVKFIQNRMSPDHLASAKLVVQEMSSPRNSTDKGNESISCDGPTSSTGNSTTSSVAPNIEDEKIKPTYGGQEGSLEDTQKAPPNVEDEKIMPNCGGQEGALEETQKAQIPPEESPLVQELQQSVDAFTKQLQDRSLSSAKRFAVKKQLAMSRSKLIRERRRLKQENG